MCSGVGNKGGRRRHRKNVQVWIVMGKLNWVPPMKLKCLLVITKMVWSYSDLEPYGEEALRCA